MWTDAAVLRAEGAPYTIEQVELDDPGPGEVLVKIAGTGLCHTDLLGRTELIGKPVILGHEGSGTIEAVGTGVTTLSVGDHVVLSFDSCGSCANCRAAHPAYCAEFFPRNLTGLAADGSHCATGQDGKPVAARWFAQSSFATHTIATARNVVRVERDLPLELLGPLGCSLLTGAGSVFNSLAVTPGSSIAVFGTGGVGLAAVMAAGVAGAATVIAVDLHQGRLDLAAELGATHTINGSDADIAAQILDLTGDGAQYSLDTTGVPSVITTAVNSLRPTGMCGLVGIQQGDLVLDPFALAGGRTLTGILEGDAVPQLLVPRLIALWKQGRFPFDRLITTYPLHEINQAEADTTTGASIKPVLIPAS
ncbi:NAD(P)-dependent alcohol dehydrogenase [Streptomyces sp. NPDC058252]|uniref:NAD(P)-dependent alcohol dehydrogenase n=1 Tax=Streptomyces sp. NPDC058252 TaxID=3346405 RepID=UPI0036E6B6A4